MRDRHAKQLTGSKPHRLKSTVCDQLNHRVLPRTNMSMSIAEGCWMLVRYGSHDIIIIIIIIITIIIIIYTLLILNLLS